MTLPTNMQQRLDQVFLDHVAADAETGSNLTVRQSFEGGEEESFAASRWQRIDGGRHEAQLLPSDDLGLGLRAPSTIPKLQGRSLTGIS